MVASTSINQHIDIGFVVWLPVMVLVSYCYFRLVMALSNAIKTAKNV